MLYVNMTHSWFNDPKNWDDRKRILLKLHSNNMTTYFYAPKEDVFHRINWRKLYPQSQIASFSRFNTLAKQKKISFIMGIAPGLDFNFKGILDKPSANSDLRKLKRKCKGIIQKERLTGKPLLFQP